MMGDNFYFDDALSWLSDRLSNLEEELKELSKYITYSSSSKQLFNEKKEMLLRQRANRNALGMAVVKKHKGRFTSGFL